MEALEIVDLCDFYWIFVILFFPWNWDNNFYLTGLLGEFEMIYMKYVREYLA